MSYGPFCKISSYFIFFGTLRKNLPSFCQFLSSCYDKNEKQRKLIGGQFKVTNHIALKNFNQKDFFSAFC